jgi:endonuclease/exonuclease/phosphatase family metal-dependent hydrolase
MNQKSITDYITTKQASGYEVNDVRVKRGAECGSDHFLLLAQVLAKNY